MSSSHPCCDEDPRVSSYIKVLYLRDTDTGQMWLQKASERMTLNVLKVSHCRHLGFELHRIVLSYQRICHYIHILSNVLSSSLCLIDTHYCLSP